MIDLPRFGLGCAQFGNLFYARTDGEVAEVVEAAWDAGVRYFDTAPHYGLGLSERRLGAFLATKPRDEFVISTKVGRLLRPNPAAVGGRDTEGFDVPDDLTRVWDVTPAGVRASLEESLTRLGLDRVDIALLHDPERSGIEGATEQGLEALVALREEGLVSRVGVGSMIPATLATAARLGADVIMAANCYTLLDCGVYPEVLAACRDHGTSVIAAAVFNSGLLSAPPSEDATYDYAQVPPEVLARARRVASVCQDFGVELPTAAMHFPLRDPLVSTVVVGAASPEQTAQNLERLDVVVPSGLWTALAAEGLIPEA